MRVDGAFRQGVGGLAILLGLTLAGLSSYCLYMDELLDVRTDLRARGVLEQLRKVAKDDKELQEVTDPNSAQLAKLEKLVVVECGSLAAGKVGEPVLLKNCPEQESGSTVAASEGDKKKKTVYNFGVYKVCTHQKDEPECKPGASMLEKAALSKPSIVAEAGAGLMPPKADARRVKATLASAPSVREGDPTVREADIEVEASRHIDRGPPDAAAGFPARRGEDDSLAQVQQTLRTAGAQRTVFGKLEDGGLIVPLVTRGGAVLYYQEGDKSLEDVMAHVQKPASRTLPLPAMLALLFLGVVAFLLGASEIPIANLPLQCCRVPVFSTCSLALINTMAFLMAACVATIVMGCAWAVYSGLLSLPWFAASFTCVLLLLFVRLRCGNDPYDDDA